MNNDLPDQLKYLMHHVRNLVGIITIIVNSVTRGQRDDTLAAWPCTLVCFSLFIPSQPACAPHSLPTPQRTPTNDERKREKEREGESEDGFSLLLANQHP